MFPVGQSTATGAFSWSRPVSSCQPELKGLSVPSTARAWWPQKSSSPPEDSRTTRTYAWAPQRSHRSSALSVRSATAVVISASLVDRYLYITSIRTKSISRMGQVRCPRIHKNGSRAPNGLTETLLVALLTAVAKCGRPASEASPTTLGRAPQAPAVPSLKEFTTRGTKF